MRLRLRRAQQVLIKTRASLISAGTETSMLTGTLEEPGTSITGQFPVVPGYSNVGEIVDVGSEVDGFSPGDRVLTMGNHATHVSIDLGGDRGGYIEKIPDSVDDVSASFGILGSVALHGMRHVWNQIGDSCAVIGQGVVGQLLGQLARIAGCYPVIGIDLFPKRLEFSKQSGLNHVVDASSEDTVDAVMALTVGQGVSLGMEATRNPNTLKTLLKIAALGGNIVIVGSLPGTVEISLWTELQFKEISIHGAWQPRAPLDGNHYFPWTQAKNRRLGSGSHSRRPAQGRPPGHQPAKELRTPPRIYEMILRGGTDWMAIAFDWTR